VSLEALRQIGGATPAERLASLRAAVPGRIVFTTSFGIEDQAIAHLIFTGRLGMIGSTILHSHESAIRFSDYGSGSNLPASRALFLGAQAGVVAYGNASDGRAPNRIMWKEEIVDYGRQINVGSGLVVGIKKARFSGKDFGMFSIDTYAKDPNN
jgi:N4-gp56 family major capsid protein